LDETPVWTVAAPASSLNRPAGAAFVTWFGAAALSCDIAGSAELAMHMPAAISQVNLDLDCMVT
jgi:hypothetical protein